MAGGKRGRRATSSESADGPTVIRKYPNRRLYNTKAGEFVTLEDLRKMVVTGEAFVVQDSKTGKDITPSILAQIIAEQESRGESVLPGDIMRRLIAFYDQGMSDGFFQQWQEQMDTFASNWQPFEAYGEIGKRNAELMRKSYETFFGGFGGGAKPDTSDGDDAGSKDDDAVARKLDELQAEIDALRAKSGDQKNQNKK